MQNLDLVASQPYFLITKFRPQGLNLFYCIFAPRVTFSSLNYRSFKNIRLKHLYFLNYGTLTSPGQRIDTTNARNYTANYTTHVSTTTHHVRRQLPCSSSSRRTSMGVIVRHDMVRVLGKGVWKKAREDEYGYLRLPRSVSRKKIRLFRYNSRDLVDLDHFGLNSIMARAKQNMV